MSLIAIAGRMVGTCGLPSQSPRPRARHPSQAPRLFTNNNIYSACALRPAWCGERCTSHYPRESNPTSKTSPQCSPIRYPENPGDGQCGNYFPQLEGGVLLYFRAQLKGNQVRDGRWRAASRCSMPQGRLHLIDQQNKAALIDLNETAHHHIIIQNDVHQTGEDQGKRGHPPAAKTPHQFRIVTG